MMKRILNRIRYLIEYYLICRASPVIYLRRRGVRIGKDCDILNHVDNFGTEPWLIELGNRVTLTGGVSLITHDGASRLFRNTLPESSPYGNRFGRIRILDNCFIGVNSIILPSVTIGPNSIVGAGSVVVRDVPPETVVTGVPAHRVASLEEYIEKYQERMVPIKSENRKDLRRELTLYFWGEER